MLLHFDIIIVDAVASNAGKHKNCIKRSGVIEKNCEPELFDDGIDTIDHANGVFIF